MAFRPFPPSRPWLPWLIVGLLLVVLLLCGAQLARTPIGPTTVLWGALGLAATLYLGTVLYRIWLVRSLDYWVQRDAVTIHCAGDVVFIPLGAIQSIAPAPAAAANLWWGWPAAWVQRRWPGRLSYATRGAESCLLLKTARSAYLISPSNPDGFRQAVRDRQQLGVARRVEEEMEIAPWREYWLLGERLPQVVLVCGLLLGLFFLAYVLWRFPELPLRIPIHFDAAGDPDRISPRRALFLLPAITLLIWFFNLMVGLALYERQRLAAYLLWGSALALHVAGFMAVRNLLQLVL